jgi:sortase A
VAIWATVLVAIWLAGYLISRRFRRYSLGIAVAIVPFALALFFFYQNVNRLLPPNL